jgi:hypothetical protein
MALFPKRVVGSSLRDFQDLWPTLHRSFDLLTGSRVKLTELLMSAFIDRCALHCLLYALDVGGSVREAHNGKISPVSFIWP